MNLAIYVFFDEVDCEFLGFWHVLTVLNGIAWVLLFLFKGILGWSAIRDVLSTVPVATAIATLATVNVPQGFSAPRVTSLVPVGRGDQTAFSAADARRNSPSTVTELCVIKNIHLLRKIYAILLLKILQIAHCVYIWELKLIVTESIANISNI